MSNNKIYKVIPIFGLVVFVVSLIIKIWELINFIELRTDFPFFIMNIIGIVAFIVLIFKPFKFEIYGMFAFLYSVMMVLDSTNIVLTVLIWLLFIICFYVRGYFKQHCKLKMSIINLIFICLFTTRIRFGIDLFVSNILHTLALLLILGVAFIVLYPTHIKPALELLHKETIDFSKYPELTERHKELINDVLVLSKRYKEIAHGRRCSESLIRKDMREVFKILGVSDLNDFLVKFSNRPIKGLDLPPPTNNTHHPISAISIKGDETNSVLFQKPWFYVISQGYFFRNKSYGA